MRRPRGPGGTRRVGWALALFFVTAFGRPVRAQAQHVAAPVPEWGAVLPDAYFERLAADPTAFTLPNGLFRVVSDGQPLTASATGTKAMLVLPALFADSPEPQVAGADIQRLLFDGPAPRGTLTESYLEMSRGKLRVTGHVLPWVRTSLTRAVVVGANAGLGSDAKVGPYLIEALVGVDSSVDFGAYDNDGLDGVPNSGDDDGFVDAIAFEFIEVAGSCGGPGIWPHLWGITPQNNGQPFFSDDMGPTGAAIRVDAYIIQSAVDCGGVNPQDAATIAHEFGHVLGLPDYYHPTASGGAELRRWVLGCWELMAAGAWGCGPHAPSGEPFGPTHMSAHSKNHLGWLDYVTVGPVWDQEIVLDPVQTSGQALRIPLDSIGREYLLVEYRTRTGFDAQLPAEGILIYHQDFQGAFRPDPASTTPYFLSVVEQDDNRGLVRNSYEGGNRGEAADAWGVAGVTQNLHFGTTPFLRLHAGGPSTVTFHEMVVRDGKARFRLSTGLTPRVMAPSEALGVQQVIPFERRLRIAGGAMPYLASGSVPTGVTVLAEGDDLVLRGSVTEPGPFQLALRVTDARGAASPQLLVPLTAGEWLVGEARLLQPFLRSSAELLSAGELTYLDFVGNGNGRYDVGDLRAWLRR